VRGGRVHKKQFKTVRPYLSHKVLHLLLWLACGLN
jgi:hypothetical protein